MPFIQERITTGNPNPGQAVKEPPDTAREEDAGKSADTPRAGSAGVRPRNPVGVRATGTDPTTTLVGPCIKRLDPQGCRPGSTTRASVCTMAAETSTPDKADGAAVVLMAPRIGDEANRTMESLLETGLSIADSFAGQSQERDARRDCCGGDLVKARAESLISSARGRSRPLRQRVVGRFARF